MWSRTEIGGCLDQSRINFLDGKKYRERHEQHVDVHESEVDASLVVEQPFDRPIDEPDPEQELIDCSGGPQDRQPYEGANDVAGPEREEHEQRQNDFPTGWLDRKKIRDRI